uniref:Ferredoxin reductase component of carbazole n=1 Tax=Janthinobacterium sp. (strain J3) TaxID=213804 RepID=Q84II0_JANS3|nr:ferredoxin reductase component of carbazole [Janthinobacterium sp. J3]
MYQLKIEGQAPGTCGSDKSLLVSALANGIGLPYECASGGCGVCKFELLEGTVQSMWPDAPGLSSRDREKGNRHLACQCIALSDLRIKVAVQDKYIPAIPISKMEAEVVAVRALTHDLLSVKLRTDVPANFLPGQFCLIEAEQLPGVVRAYSMANSMNPDGFWEFYIKRVPTGRFSPWLFENRKVGARLFLTGPMGTSFFRPGTGRKSLCIGGGAGLSYAAAIARASIRETDKPVKLFYGSRTPRDAVRWIDIDIDEDKLEVVQAVTEDTDSLWQGPIGFIHQVVDAALLETLPEYEIYLAGPPPMVDATVRMLLGKGVPRDQIHFDAFF